MTIKTTLINKLPWVGIPGSRITGPCDGCCERQHTGDCGRAENGLDKRLQMPGLEEMEGHFRERGSVGKFKEGGGMVYPRNLRTTAHQQGWSMGWDGVGWGGVGGALG